MTWSTRSRTRWPGSHRGSRSPTSASPACLTTASRRPASTSCRCFTQWVPHTYAQQTDETALAAYADRVVARMETVAPGFTSSVLHRQVIGPRPMQEEYG